MLCITFYCQCSLPISVAQTSTLKWNQQHLSSEHLNNNALVPICYQKNGGYTQNRCKQYKTAKMFDILQWPEPHSTWPCSREQSPRLQPMQPSMPWLPTEPSLFQPVQHTQAFDTYKQSTVSQNGIFYDSRTICCNTADSMDYLKANSCSCWMFLIGQWDHSAMWTMFNYCNVPHRIFNTNL